ncbi:MAG: serine hydrolase domain-containing protein [Terrimicrobiaceae bacterium]
MVTSSAPGELEFLQKAFEENFSLGLECGAALSVWRDGEECVTLFGGFQDQKRMVPWTARTRVLVWSATKGPSSACVVHALERGGISMETPVSDIWPTFAANGKSGIRIREVLGHRAGLAALTDRAVRFDDPQAVAEALAAQKPLWEPGTGHGYSPRAFGYLLDEICRRISGLTVGAYWRKHFGDPLGLDFWIGLPENENVAQMLPPRLTASAGEKTAFERAYAEPGSPTNSAFSTPAGLLTASAMNRPEIRAGSYPAFGGIGSASSLAKFYGMLACDGQWEGQHFFSSDSMNQLKTRVSDGWDLVLQRETAFSAGLMMDPLSEGQKIRETFGPGLSAFGHPGAGGSLAFADPVHKIGFAYVMNQMEPGAMPRERTLRLVRALYSGWDLGTSP